MTCCGAGSRRTTIGHVTARMRTIQFSRNEPRGFNESQLESRNRQQCSARKRRASPDPHDKRGLRSRSSGLVEPPRIAPFGASCLSATGHLNHVNRSVNCETPTIKEDIISILRARGTAEDSTFRHPRLSATGYLNHVGRGVNPRDIHDSRGSNPPDSWSPPRIAPFGASCLSATGYLNHVNHGVNREKPTTRENLFGSSGLVEPPRIAPFGASCLPATGHLDRVNRDVNTQRSTNKGDCSSPPCSWPADAGTSRRPASRRRVI